MNTIPDAADLDLRHPSWCSPEHCTSPDRLRERGISELEVERWRRDQHWSAPHAVGDDDDDRQAEASFEFALTRWVFQPVMDEPDQLVMVVRFTEYPVTLGVAISGRQARVMAEALLEYAGAWPVNGGAR